MSPVPICPQDGGGFFVAVIRRRDSLQVPAPQDHVPAPAAASPDSAPAAVAPPSSAVTPACPPALTAAAFESAAAGGAKGRRARRAKQPPPHPLGAADRWLFASLADFYGLPPALGPSPDNEPEPADPAAPHESANGGGGGGDGGDGGGGGGGGGGVLLLEGRRVVLASVGIAALVARLSRSPALALHSAGLRLFYHLRPSAFRSAAACRWRPCQASATDKKKTEKKRKEKKKTRPTGCTIIQPPCDSSPQLSPPPLTR